MAAEQVRKEYGTSQGLVPRGRGCGLELKCGTMLGALGVTIQLRWGAHAPSRAVVGALADHTDAHNRVIIG